jgi:hypothetical protein
LRHPIFLAVTSRSRKCSAALDSCEAGIQGLREKTILTGILYSFDIGRAVRVVTDTCVLMEMILGLLEHSSSSCAKGCRYIEDNSKKRCLAASLPFLGYPAGVVPLYNPRRSDKSNRSVGHQRAWRLRVKWKMLRVWQMVALVRSRAPIDSSGACNYAVDGMLAKGTLMISSGLGLGLLGAFALTPYHE